MDSKKFLGTGWSFPPQFSANGKNLEMTSNLENVHKSLEVILHTDLGERTLQEDFGASLRRFLFEPLSNSLLIDMKERVSNAIVRHEPRVILDNVEIVQNKLEAGLLLIQLQYTVRSTNTRFNMVYPFYLNEASVQP